MPPPHHLLQLSSCSGRERGRSRSSAVQALSTAKRNGRTVGRSYLQVFRRHSQNRALCTARIERLMHVCQRYHLSPPFPRTFPLRSVRSFASEGREDRLWSLAMMLMAFRLPQPFSRHLAHFNPCQRNHAWRICGRAYPRSQSGRWSNNFAEAKIESRHTVEMRYDDRREKRILRCVSSDVGQLRHSRNLAVPTIL